VSAVRFAERDRTIPTYHAELETSYGRLLVVGNDTQLLGLYFEGARYLPELADSKRSDRAPFAEVERQLGEYFAGERESFDLEVAPQGTPFQLEVWRGLVGIAYGETRSYGELAAAIGRPRAIRALGSANSRNPISIVVPCHRVIGADGSLTGYAGGLENKRALLALEQRRK
jgi:methylated-DNA-[protein]-cysteine S-methyltransferase